MWVVFVGTGEIFLVFILGNFDEQAHGLSLVN